MAMGQPDRCGEGATPSELSAAQRSCLRRFEAGYNRLALAGPVPARGGRVQLVEELHRVRAALYGRDRLPPPRGGPLPLEAARLDFPSAAGTISLEEYNENQLREALQDPGRIVREAPVDGALPVGCQPRPLDQWLLYLERAEAAGGLCVLGAEEVPRHEGVALTAGFFSVTKDEFRARGITGAWSCPCPSGGCPTPPCSAC